MLGIYSAEERQRHLETGSYEPVEEDDTVVEVRGAPAPSLETTTEEGAVVEEAGHGRLETTRMETHDTRGSEMRTVPSTQAKTAHTSAELLE